MGWDSPLCDSRYMCNRDTKYQFLSQKKKKKVYIYIYIYQKNTHLKWSSLAFSIDKTLLFIQGNPTSESNNFLSLFMTENSLFLPHFFFFFLFYINHLLISLKKNHIIHHIYIYIYI